MPLKTDTIWADRTSKDLADPRSEGIQRFLFLDSLGVGRFVKICIPWPQQMDSLRAIARVVLVSFMIHELLLSPPETASGSHPCCVTGFPLSSDPVRCAT
jgi:hypothetical protein